MYKNLLEKIADNISNEVYILYVDTDEYTHIEGIYKNEDTAKKDGLKYLISKKQFVENINLDKENITLYIETYDNDYIEELKKKSVEDLYEIAYNIVKTEFLNTGFVRSYYRYIRVKRYDVN